jgi:hypothetical protein
MKNTVAICDILGFSKLIKKNSLDSIVENHLAWLGQAIWWSIHKKTPPQILPSLKEIQNQTKLGFARFSDTLMLYTIDDTDDSLRELLSSTGWLLFSTMFDSYTRLRCGLAYGKMHLDSKNSLYLGQPIIDADQLQKNQAWAGGALTESAVNRLPEVAKSENSVYDWYVVPYKVPLKGGLSIDTFAIDWTIGSHFSFQPLWSQEKAEPTHEDWITNHEICEKWYNTKVFHDKLCRTCDIKKRES